MIAKFIFCAAFLFAIIAAVPMPAFAQSAEDRASSARRLWEEMNLTPEQEARFREINARYSPTRRDYNRRIDEVRARINQELAKDRPSRGLLAQWAGEMGEIQKRLNIASVNHMLEVKAVLTPQQFQIFMNNTQIGGSGRGRRGERSERGGERGSAAQPQGDDDDD